MNKISQYVAQYAGGLACVVFINTPAMAADLASGPLDPCAVSATNGKIEAGGGYYEGSSKQKGAAFQGAGSVAFALGCSFGFQLDTAIGSLDKKTTGGVAGHLFTRNPNSYLAGVYADYSLVGKNDIWRVGAEGELYLSQITFSALAGYENSDLTKGDLFASIGASFYVTDNFRLSAGYRRFLDVNAGYAEAEWMFAETPLSVFGGGQIGNKNHLLITAGVRYHFGGETKSLIRRHREDDPFNVLTDLMRRVKKPNNSSTPTVMTECCTTVN